MSFVIFFKLNTPFWYPNCEWTHMALWLVILHVIILQQQIMQQCEDVKTMFYVSSQQTREFTPHTCTLWKYDWIEGFMQKQVMGSYFQEMFRQSTKLNFCTLSFCVKNWRHICNVETSILDYQFLWRLRLLLLWLVLVVDFFNKWLVRCMGLLKV